MILEALKSLYPNASEKVLIAVKEELRKVPRLLERIRKPCRSSHLRIRLQARSKAHDGGAIGYNRITSQASVKHPMPIF